MHSSQFFPLVDNHYFTDIDQEGGRRKDGRLRIARKRRNEEEGEKEEMKEREERLKELKL